MATKNRAVFGIYPSPVQAERAVNALVDDGFLSQDVSVLMPDTESTRAFAHRKETKAPEGATAGATAGGVVGGALGVLIALGSLTIPGVGPLIAAGPLVAGLAGLGAGGAVGGLLGALVGAGIPEYEAKRYEGRVKDGGVLLSVHAETEGEVLRAKEILRATGADDVATAGEAAAGARATTEETRHEQRSHRG
jgi:heat induced stress protein YflT